MSPTAETMFTPRRMPRRTRLRLSCEWGRQLVLALVVGGALGLALAASTRAFGQEPPSPPSVEEGGRPLGQAAAWSVEATDTERVASSGWLRRQPHPQAQVLRRVDVGEGFETLETEGDWLRIRLDGVVGWLARVVDPRPARELGADDRALAALERRERLLGRLSASVDELIGGFRLLSDLNGSDPRLPAVRTLLRNFESTYRERYQVESSSLRSAAEPIWVGVFAQLEGYEDYLAEEGAIVEVGSLGHEAPGVLAVVAAERTRDELLAILAHELVHALNREAFSPLPPWLEEGLAEELASSQFSSAGHLLSGTLAGVGPEVAATRLEQGERVVGVVQTVRGPAYAWLCANSVRLGEVGLRELVQLNAWQLSAQEGRTGRYAGLGALVRFLIEAPGRPELRRRFLRFLSELSRTTPSEEASPDESEVLLPSVAFERLLVELELSSSELEEQAVAAVRRGLDPLRCASLAP